MANKVLKTTKGFPLLQEYKKLGEIVRESSENFSCLNEELNKNLVFQKMCINLFQCLIDPHMDLDATAKQILARIINSLALEAGTIHILHEGENFRLIASSSVPKELLERLKEVYIGEGIIGRAVMSKEPIILSNADSKGILKDERESGDLIITPIRANGKSIGVLTLLAAQKKYFTEDDIAMFSILSTHLGIGFKNNILFEEAKTLATKDGLTDLHNRVYFHEFLSLELNRSKRYGKPLSLAMMDIDYFKNINDTYGHHVGDLILKEFADMLKKSFRKTDLVARYGGEEFVAVFPEADTENTIKAVEKLQKKLNNHFFKGNGKKHKITISMGISAFNPEKKISQKELILRADKALYNAKESGRNTVRVYNI